MNHSDPRTYPCRERFSFLVEGTAAMFCRPHNPWNRDTYPFPTPSVVRGLVKSIFHNNFYFVVPLRVEVLKPIKTESIPQTVHRNLVLNSKRASTAAHPSAFQGAVYLTDVAYRITFEAWAPDSKKLRRLAHMLAVRGFYNPPFLGTRECVARLVEEVVDEEGNPLTPVQGLTMVEPLMAVGDRQGPVHVKDGVVEYPEWTREALLKWRAQRMQMKEARS